MTQKQLSVTHVDQKFQSVSNEIKVISAKISDLSIKLQERKKTMIQSLIDIFRLRKVSRTSKTGTFVEYRIVNGGMPPLDTLHKISHRHHAKLNTCIGHIIHLLIILTNYLNIYLPFAITMHPQEIQKISLTFSSTNQDQFIQALSMLNFNLIHICASQSISISLSLSTKPLDILAKLLSASTLGRTDLAFMCIDYEEVYDHHMTKWRSRPWEIVDEFNDAWLVVNNENESSQEL
jgi:hypothetical protein